MVLPALKQAHAASRRASCQDNLRQFHTVFSSYAAENNGMYPDRTLYTLGWFDEMSNFDIRDVYPDYLTDVSIMKCPGDQGVYEGDFLAAAPDDFLEGKADIEALIDAGQATEACLLGHLSFPRSYIYCAWAATNATEWMLPHQAWWYGSMGLEGIRAATGDQADSSLSGEPIMWEGENINPDLGPDCLYNDCFYTDDNTNWYGFRVLKKGAVYRFGADRGWSENGDLDVTSIFLTRNRRYSSDRSQLAGPIIYRMHEGIGQFFTTDVNNPEAVEAAEATIPVLFDWWGKARMGDERGGSNNYYPADQMFHHLPGGVNVLYKDGHVAFMRHRQTISTPELVQEGPWPASNGLYGEGTHFDGAMAWAGLGKG